MIIKLRNMALFFMLVTMASGCSKSEPIVAPVPPVITEPVTPPSSTPTPPLSNAKLVPIKIESVNETITLKYLGNTALITSIEENSKGRKGIINYDNNKLISGYEIYENNQLIYFIDYWRDVNQRINNVNQFKNKGIQFTPTGYYTLEYNNLNQLSIIKFYSSQKQLLGSKSLNFDAASNIISIIINTGQEEKSVFTYDGKNGLFKNVDNARLISLEFNHKLFNSLVNNLITKTGTFANQDFNCTYEYNSDSFPSQITLHEANIKTIFKITYKTL
ncbi:hypothetical protein AAKU52_002815 [Pedobacter sp. CG_S7]|uniref:hypothetical protein n=1 Tax=Pedobacter sp. CG_S7 TaxID=3143930 RepID=UPI003395F72C